MDPEQDRELTDDESKVLSLLTTPSYQKFRTAGEIAVFTGLAITPAKMAIAALVKAGSLEVAVGTELKGIRTLDLRLKSTYYAPSGYLKFVRDKRAEAVRQASEDDADLKARLVAYEALAAMYYEEFQALYEAERARVAAPFIAEPYSMTGPAMEGQWTVVRNNAARNVVRFEVDGEDVAYGTKEQAFAAAEWRNADYAEWEAGSAEREELRRWDIEVEKAAAMLNEDKRS